MEKNAQGIQHATIVMVDDEPTTMYVVQTYLEEFGYSNFIQVEDATRAVRTVEESLPDILLLDLVMPGVSGFDILQELRGRKRFKYLPIIVLTSSSDAENKLRALELGATDFLAKPVDKSELGLRVRNTLAAKAYMDQLAFYDPLTQLPNKFLFDDRFAWSLDKARRYQDRLALMNISIDNFSRINATIGVDAADQVLKVVANRLSALVRAADSLTFSLEETDLSLSLFRLEGSVFSVLLDRTRSAESAALVAERILGEIRKPIQVGENELYITASIGIANYPDEGELAATLVQLANSAKDFTKNQGGNSFHFSSPAINNLYQDRLQLESKLRRALEREEFILHYQPKVDLRSGMITGVEALLRWQPAGGALVPPGRFIALLEETGLIIEVGAWILKEAVSRQLAWRQAGIPPLSMAVNLSVKQLDDPGLFELLQQLGQETALGPELIHLEITESLLLADIDAKVAFMEQVRALGFKISIDDFGTGYSSLCYLAQLPVDELKIDRSFIRDVAEMEESRAIVSSIIFLAKSLGLSTVAEGIETPEQLSFLGEAGCDLFQGFYFSKPLAEEALLKLLEAGEA